MKKAILTIFLMTSMTIVSFGQQVQETSVYMYANSTMVEKILDAKEIEFESLDLNSYQMKLNGFNVFIAVDDGDLILRTLILRTHFSDKPSLNRINDFNMQYRWTRVYLDSYGDLTVAQELSFKGGITLENVNAFISTYGAVLVELVKQIQ